MTDVVVITTVRGRHAHLRRQQASLVAQERATRQVLVSMGDDELLRWPSPDGLPTHLMSLPAADRLPLAAARNLGAGCAIEWGAEVLVFLDVDCLAGPDLVAAYANAAMRERHTVWSGPVTYLPPDTAPAPEDLWRHDDPHPARPAPGPARVLPADPDLFWSLSFAMHRDAWRESGGFCEEYVGYGGEDTDFATQCRVAGLRFSWHGSARAYHQWHPVSDPPVEHVADIVRNATLFHSRWNRWPMLGWLEAFEERGLVRRTPRGWASS